MKSSETAPQHNSENDTAVMERIGRSKIIKKVAVAIAALGLVGGAAEGVKSAVESASHHLTPIEYVHDSSGYKAEQSKDNLNNPNTILRLVGTLDAKEKPYVLVHTPGMKKGVETRVDIQTAQEIAKDGDLTDLGIAAREVLIRSEGAKAFGRENTPALQEDHFGIHLQDARDEIRNGLYTGSVNSANERLQDASQPERVITIDGAAGGYEKVVEPATSSLER